jgi:hypothetical protein
MPIEPSWFGKLLEYSSAVVGYWQFWVAVAFMMERALERFMPNLWKGLDPHWTPARRRQVFMWISAIAFLYANFRAYDDVSSQLRAKNIELIEALKQRATTEHQAKVTARLQEFLVQIQQLFEKGMGINQNTTDDDYSKWAKDVDTWSADLEKYAVSEMGPSIRARMMQPPFESITLRNAKNPDHNHTMSAIINQKRNLVSLEQSPFRLTIS